MGTCWNCNTQVSLGKDQTKCDNCHEILFYRCNDCKEKFEIQKIKKKDSEEEYEVFVRCEKTPCKYLARDDLVITYCEKCKSIFPKETQNCNKCNPYSKGKNNGQLRKLKERLNNKDVCQVYRGSFI